MEIIKLNVEAVVMVFIAYLAVLRLFFVVLRVRKQRSNTAKGLLVLTRVLLVILTIMFFVHIKGLIWG